MTEPVGALPRRPAMGHENRALLVGGLMRTLLSAAFTGASRQNCEMNENPNRGRGEYTTLRPRRERGRRTSSTDPFGGAEACRAVRFLSANGGRNLRENLGVGDPQERVS